MIARRAFLRVLGHGAAVAPLAAKAIARARAEVTEGPKRSLKLRDFEETYGVWL